MKKRATALLATLALLFTCALAAAEINVTKRDLSQATDLDKNVSHILVILQDGETTDTLMLASINSRTGRSVMTRVDCGTQIELTQGDGTSAPAALADVYVQGGKKSRGLLVCREINELLGLNVSTYVALDVSQLPELVNAIGSVNLPLTEEEAAAMGMTWDYHDLTGEQVLEFVRLDLPGDDGSRSRCYEALMQMLYQGVKGGDISSLASMGTKLLKNMDSNLNVMTAVTLVSAVQAGDDRREAYVSASMSEEEMRELVHREIYE